MRNLVLGDLQTVCWDFSNFTRRMQDLELELPLRPYDIYCAGDLPRRQYNTSNAIDTNAPRFNPLDYTTLSDGEMFQVPHLTVQTPYSDSELSVVGHAAWALACYEVCKTSEIEFISVNPASHGHLQEFQSIMSPIAEGVQVWVPMKRSMQIGELLSNLEKSSESIIGRKHGPTKAPDVDVLFYSMLFRGVFQWDPFEGGCVDRTFAFFDPGVAPAIIRSVCAESIPPSHDYGLLLSMQEADGEITIQCTWDTILGKAQVDQMFERFIHFFDAVVKGRGVKGQGVNGQGVKGQGDTVGDLLAN